MSEEYKVVSCSEELDIELHLNTLAVDGWRPVCLSQILMPGWDVRESQGGYAAWVRTTILLARRVRGADADGPEEEI